MTTPLFFFLIGLLSQRGGGAVFPPANSTPQTQTTASISCQTELRWVNSDQKFLNLGNSIQINLFSAVGAGCTPSELRVTAIYLDSDENVVCSGVVEGVAQLDQNTQSTILEFKPLSTQEFVRWRSGLRPPQPLARRLVCIGPDQLTEVSRLETDRASSVRIYITLLSRGGGMFNLEIKVDPRR